MKTIKNLMQVSGGVGVIIGFVHDWANPENTSRSWDMVARYVVPEINGYIDGLRRSQTFVIENRAIFERVGQAVMAKIMANDKAAATLAHTGPGRVAIPAVNAPDLQAAAAKRKGETVETTGRISVIRLRAKGNRRFFRRNLKPLVAFKPRNSGA